MEENQPTDIKKAEINPVEAQKIDAGILDAHDLMVAAT
jgi:hypothetical protein